MVCSDSDAIVIYVLPLFGYMYLFVVVIAYAGFFPIWQSNMYGRWNRVQIHNMYNMYSCIYLFKYVYSAFFTSYKSCCLCPLLAPILPPSRRRIRCDMEIFHIFLIVQSNTFSIRACVFYLFSCFFFHIYCVCTVYTYIVLFDYAMCPKLNSTFKFRWIEFCVSSRRVIGDHPAKYIAELYSIKWRKMLIKFSQWNLNKRKIVFIFFHRARSESVSWKLAQIKLHAVRHLNVVLVYNVKNSRKIRI